jgi:glutamine amidotransferase
MQVAIVKYNAGNIQSVVFALQRLGVEPIITDNAELLRSADRVIFPGVGEASSAMQYLKSKALDKVIRSLHQPVLGICLGLQLLCRHSEEGNTDCLGIFDVEVKAFDRKGSLKVPHVGWNTIEALHSPLMIGIEAPAYMYFVHSYYAEWEPRYAIARCEYGVPFSAGLHKNNFYAVQFHPEKSAKAGSQLLENFLKMP